MGGRLSSEFYNKHENMKLLNCLVVSGVIGQIWQVVLSRSTSCFRGRVKFTIRWLSSSTIWATASLWERCCLPSRFSWGSGNAPVCLCVRLPEDMSHACCEDSWRVQHRFLVQVKGSVMSILTKKGAQGWPLVDGEGNAGDCTMKKIKQTHVILPSSGLTFTMALTQS